MATRISLAELATADIQLRPAEAVSIVSEICRRCAAGELRGVPSPGVIRLSRDGDLFVEGPTTTGDDVARAAHLLNDLLSAFDAAPEYRAGGPLRLVIARAVGSLDVPAYGSLEEFCVDLDRFAAADLGDAARGLFHAWERATVAQALEQRDEADLTISDIRRARRATGLTLQDLAEASGVSSVKLRDLEWGYTRGWRADAEGRTQVVRYARAAGLDETLVLSIAWPLIEESSAMPAEPQTVQALVPSGPQHLEPVGIAAPPPSRRGVYRWAAVAAAVVLLAIAAVMALLRPPDSVLPAPPKAVATNSAPRLPAAVPPMEVTPTPAPAAGPPAAVVPASNVSSRRAAPVRAKAAPRRAAPPVRQQRGTDKGPLLGRELFRIVIR